MPSSGRCLAALPVLALGLAACGTDAPAASSGPAPSSAAASTSSAAAAGPEDAVSTWVTAVLREEYQKACELTASPGDDLSKCSSPTATRTFRSLHEAWAKPGVTLPPQAPVKVSTTTAGGDAMSVPDTAITVDGHSLHDLMLIGSSGEGVGNFHLTLKLKQQDGSWRVSGLDLK
ncbi:MULTISPECIES: hypothetical protein [Amycolatopsis]|uniref:Lipoprotein n=2 Tax=Amycolatopsis TaxID=1813 RepID=A0A1I3NHE8_9PSEU|nr:hypothetical protein [Amycolatopsis sacchari]SFJ08733.1 hypothetical protein SAMN05421835_10332 [Amycolatopsis sacchari]